MRILFSATPAAGHVLPLVPLADAAGDAGHDVAFLTGPDMAGYLGSRTLVPAGPGIAELMAETARRTGGDDGLRLSGASVELFVGARIDLTYDQALDQARRFAPDLLVCEALDFVGPLVAAALERGARDAQAARCVADHRRRIEGALHATLLRGRADGSLKSRAGAAKTARLLLTVVFGLRLLAKSGGSPAELAEVARLAQETT